ncbi:uncharacterized protein [Drosophila takahashii]|uniref:uncharacterized protein n=1 Tax=Drosophila takahashii TaxID=29030 RepID=UPI001CF8931B|nr:uncharacterized protein LOC108063722 [Drosophila takahashii]
MRSLFVVALLAFLAVGFVAARPAEDEESSSSAVVDSTAVDSTSNDADTTKATEEKTEGSTDDKDTTATKASAVEETEESSDNAETENDTTTEAVKKHIRPFWPRFGGHGPVVIRRHPGLETV